MSRPASLLRNAGIVAAATLASRLLGLLRDQVQSWIFGAGFATDAFVAAYRIPNALRDLFAEGALSSAFVPAFTRLERERGRDAAFDLARRTLTLLAVTLAAAAVLIAWGAPALVGLYAAGFDDDKARLAIAMTQVLSPFLLFIALAAVAMGMLHAAGRFVAPASAPAWFNVVCLVAMIALPATLARAGFAPALALAVGATAGGLAQFLVQIPALRRTGFRFGLDWAPRDREVRRLLRAIAPAAVGLAATQVNVLVDTVIASSLGDGPITWLQLAFRLVQLPIGLFGVALATVHLQRASHQVASGDLGALREGLDSALRTAAILTLPAAAGLIALARPIARLLFEHGRFTPESTAATAAAASCYALGLYAYVAVKIEVPTYYALGDSRAPARATVASVAFKIAATLGFLALLPAVGVPPFLALAVATSLAAWLNLAFLSRGLRRRLGPGRSVTGVVLRIGALSAGMGVACAMLSSGLEVLLPGSGVGLQAARLGASIVAGIVLTFAGALAMRLPEAIRARDRLEALASSRRGR